jgi:RHH-type proline utilization regulon transcriptional repressor/proline dehydrogenase/delta 1-pyrroline-5-carboxylate dehydrogenase
LACAKALLARRDCFYPQFATHNAHTLCAIVELAGADNRFEFQRLHGMGEALYETVTKGGVGASACRVYAPVGRHRELLPYLVRRLLENGANTSFVHQLRDPNEPIENLIDDPVQTAAALADKPHPLIAPPPKLFGKARENSLGINLSNTQELSTLSRALESAARKPWQAAPVVVEEVKPASLKKVLDPADTRRTVGEVFEATAADAERALNVAHGAQWQWNRQGAAARATILEAAANRFEAHRGDFIYLLVREAGKCLRDADAEVREAVDYCRYYAALARKTFANPLILDGPTGEENRLSLNGRGVFWCVSPWNFPLAIFTGQVAAALAAGNAVIAKPARATPLVAALAVRLLFEADVPRELLHFLPGPGALLGQVLLKDSRLAGVAFTGSTDTAHDLQRQLTVRGGALVPLIAETGGQNAMIVDSSALLEQAATDALTAAFNSVGQRCSALRVLFLQNDIADRALEIIKGAMDELVIGDPMSLTTDVGPVIDAQAQRALEQHDASLRVHAKLVHQIKLPPETEHGHFFGPRVFEIDSLSRLTGEVFGPCLHVVRYAADHLDKVCAAINATGYGLTLGVHTRVQTTARYIEERVRAGNLYVNRNQIGAVVGVQPFGGEGLSGTGFKAGGPHYLLRFATERVVSTNTAAVGGNTTLLSLDE